VQNPDQQRLSWNNHLPVLLYIHNSVPTQAYGSIDRAVQEFNSHFNREIFRVAARGVGGDLAPKKDGYSTIYWFNTWDQKKSNEQARTTIQWVGAEIFEADMRINAVNFSYYFGTGETFSGLDLESLLVHELGHVLGQEHSVTTGSVMYFSLGQGQVRRKLNDQDLANLKCEY